METRMIIYLLADIAASLRDEPIGAMDILADAETYAALTHEKKGARVEEEQTL